MSRYLRDLNVKEDELSELKNELAENSDLIEQRDALQRQLTGQSKMLENFQFAITAELGQDLSNTGFMDDESLSPVERIQMAISGYFEHQKTLREELLVRDILYYSDFK